MAERLGIVEPAGAVPDDTPASGLLRSHPGAVLGTSAVIFAVLYLYLLRNVGIANDEWTFLLYRMTSLGRFSSLQTSVAPYNNQPIIGEILLYRLWANTAGVTHHWLLDLLFVCMQIGVVALVYTMARRRAGPWPAVACGLLVLVMGRAWETLLTPASMTFVAPALAACAAWATLDRRRSTFTWVLVSALVAVASVTGGLGIAVIAGVCVEVVLARRWRGLWLVASGAIPMIVWYLSERGTIGVDVAANLRHVPLWAAKYLAAAAGAAVGLPAAGGVVVLLVAAIAAIGLWRQRSCLIPSGWTPRSAGLVVALALAVLTTGAARASDTPATSSRYLYFPAVVMILLACEWATGLRLGHRRLAAGVGAPQAPRPDAALLRLGHRRLAAGVGAGVVVLAAVLGAQQFRDGKVVYWTAADGTAARMGAMRLVGGPPVLFEPSRLAYSPAFLNLFVRRFGSGPIYTQAQIARALPASRSAVDSLLATVDVRPGGFPRPCSPAPGSGALARAGATVTIATSTPRIAQLVRFAGVGSGVDVPVPAPRVVFRVRGDRITTAWRVVAPRSKVYVCR